jgi:hypothetical protein
MNGLIPKRWRYHGHEKTIVPVAEFPGSGLSSEASAVTETPKLVNARGERHHAEKLMASCL